MREKNDKETKKLKFAMSFVRKLAKKAVPSSFEVPARYFYARLRGKMPSELFLVDKYIPIHSRCVDIGANYGTISYILAKKVRYVEAFEPQEKCAQVISAFGKDNVTVHQIALSNRNGFRILKIPLTGGRPVIGLASLEKSFKQQKLLHVPTATLDSYDFVDVSLIKIDVEGHEYAVLQGSEATIRREKPILLVEIEQRHLKARRLREVIQYVLDFGYRAYFLEKKEMKSVTEFSIERHQNPANMGTRSYINNFIFMPL